MWRPIPELRLDNAAEAHLDDDSVLRYEHEGLVAWTAPRHGEAGNMAWLDYRDGRIAAKNPDEEIIGKLCAIAASSLGAHVQGNDGESYPLADSGGCGEPERHRRFGDAPPSPWPAEGIVERLERLYGTGSRWQRMTIVGARSKTTSPNASVTSISGLSRRFRRDDPVGVRQRFESALRRVVSEAASRCDLRTPPASSVDFMPPRSSP